MPSWKVTCPACGVSFTYSHIGRIGKYTTPAEFRFCEESEERMKDAGRGYSDVLECSKMRQEFEAVTGMRLSGW